MNNIPLEELFGHMQTILNLSHFDPERAKSNNYNDSLAVAVAAHLVKRCYDEGYNVLYEKDYQALKTIALKKTVLKYDKTIFKMNPTEVNERIRRRINFLVDYFYEKVRKHCEVNKVNFIIFYDLVIDFHLNTKGDIDYLEGDLQIVEETIKENQVLITTEISTDELNILSEIAKKQGLTVEKYLRKKILEDIKSSEKKYDESEMLVSD